MEDSPKTNLAVFKAVDFSFEYPNGKRALDNLSFEINSGDFVLLCGQSGSGKTTLLRHLKNIAPRGKTYGKLYYSGQEIKSVSKSLVCDAGFVFQNPEDQIVCDHVFAELAFGLENLGIPSNEIRQRIAETAAFFGIDFMEQETYTLSGGQKQMINLASVMAMHPSVLLLDEPTSQLDPVHSSEFFSALTRLNRELGMTVIITEHRLEEIYPLVDKVMLLDNGGVICYEHPRGTADYIFNSNNKMRYALPSAARISNEINSAYRPIPLTVKQGREFLRSELNETTTDNKDKPVANVKYASRLEIKNVFFRYKKQLPDVINNLSFTADSGEITCIFGGNGEGKTTLLQLICNVLKLYRGKILFDKKPIQHRQVGYMPQNPLSMFVKDSLKEDLALFGESLGLDWKQIENIIQRYSFFEGIKLLFEQQPMDISGGELQKAAFLKLKLLNPKIILLDEPTKGIDAFAKYDLSKILKELANEGICIIMSTHDIEFAAEYADKCAMLFDGQIVSEGTPSEFFSSNHFYTTAANKISRQFDAKAVTVKDVVDYAVK